MEKKTGGADLGWLSTHPALDERVQATQHDDSGAAAMSAAEWKNLQAICEGGSRSAPIGPDKPKRIDPDGSNRDNGTPNPAPDRKPPVDPPLKGRGTNGRDKI